MKARLEFDLPEEQQEFELCHKAREMYVNHRECTSSIAKLIIWNHRECTSSIAKLIIWYYFALLLLIVLFSVATTFLYMARICLKRRRR